MDVTVRSKIVAVNLMSLLAPESVVLIYEMAGVDFKATLGFKVNRGIRTLW